MSPARPVPLSSGSLHLLRPFTGWRSGRSLVAAEAYVEQCRAEGHDRFYSMTARIPRREPELQGGSVYFVRGGRTLFRMPFVEIERRGRFSYIVVRPEIVRVEPLKVGFLRGWRYLEGRLAPPDLETSMPPDLRTAADTRYERSLTMS